jgi:hypothetical protein
MVSPHGQSTTLLASANISARYRDELAINHGGSSPRPLIGANQVSIYISADLPTSEPSLDHPGDTFSCIELLNNFGDGTMDKIHGIVRNNLLTPDQPVPVTTAVLIRYPPSQAPTLKTLARRLMNVEARLPAPTPFDSALELFTRRLPASNEFRVTSGVRFVDLTLLVAPMVRAILAQWRHL